MAPAPPPLGTLSEEPTSTQLSPSPGWRRWVRSRMALLRSRNNPDLRVLLSVLACPLSPVPAAVPPPPDQVASSAEYIIRQFRAAAGCGMVAAAAGGAGVRSMYAAGTVRLMMVEDPAAAVVHLRPRSYEGCFVLWQRAPGMWLLDMAVAGHRVASGSDGKVAWRRTPCLGAHAARGGARPLRRALQGLDPAAIAAVFAAARHVGEKRLDGEDCFVLQLDVGGAVLSSWSSSSAEVIRHAVTGYFSQRSGLLVRLDDSQLTRIQSPGAPAFYWETTISSCIGDYRRVDGVAVAYSGRSTVQLTRFGVGVKDTRVVTQMEEEWAIDDVAFGVQGLSPESFIPPEDVRLAGCLHEKK